MTVLAPSLEADAASERWTAEHVCDLFCKARVAFSGVTIRAQLGQLEDLSKVIGDQRFAPGALKVMMWLSRYGPAPGDVVMFREWLRVKAHGGGDASLRGLCAEKGWSWSTFKEARRRVCARVAAGLTRDGIPWFDLNEDGTVKA